MRKLWLLCVSVFLACAFPAIRVSADQQITVPGSFATNMGGNWQLNLVENTEAMANSETSDKGKPVLHVKVPTAGAKRYYVQLVCKGVSLQAAKIYRLHFRVRSQPDTDLSVIAGSYHGKFEELWRQDHIASKDGWTEYNCDIKPKLDEGEAQIIFGGLAGVAGDYWFTDVSLGEGK